MDRSEQLGTQVAFLNLAVPDIQIFIRKHISITTLQFIVERLRFISYSVIQKVTGGSARIISSNNKHIHSIGALIYCTYHKGNQSCFSFALNVNNVFSTQRYAVFSMGHYSAALLVRLTGKTRIFFRFILKAGKKEEEKNTPSYTAQECPPPFPSDRATSGDS